jgi:hypothetical protein
MKPPNFQTMPVDQLWELYEQIGRSLSKKLMGASKNDAFSM